jgi:hypothetical protein
MDEDNGFGIGLPGYGAPLPPRSIDPEKDDLVSYLNTPQPAVYGTAPSSADWLDTEVGVMGDEDFRRILYDAIRKGDSANSEQLADAILGGNIDARLYTDVLIADCEGENLEELRVLYDAEQEHIRKLESSPPVDLKSIESSFASDTALRESIIEGSEKDTILEENLVVFDQLEDKDGEPIGVIGTPDAMLRHNTTESNKAFLKQVEQRIKDKKFPGSVTDEQRGLSARIAEAAERKKMKSEDIVRAIAGAPTSVRRGRRGSMTRGINAASKLQVENRRRNARSAPPASRMRGIPTTSGIVDAAKQQVVSGFVPHTPAGEGIRKYVVFEKSDTTIRLLYQNKSRWETPFFCYLCSLPIDGYAEFEHVIPFRSAIVKGLIPVPEQSDRVRFVQRCLGEWAHRDCNYPLKSDNDLTNNSSPSYKLSKNWDHLSPDETAIKDLLDAIWVKNTQRVFGEKTLSVQNIYGRIETFREVHGPKLIKRIEMSCKFIKEFVDHKKYRIAKIYFSKLIGYWGSNPDKIDPTDLLTKFFLSSNNPVDEGKVVARFTGKPTANPYLKSPTMFLNSHGNSIQQSRVCYEGGCVHPADGTHGAKLYTELFGALVGGVNYTPANFNDRASSTKKQTCRQQQKKLTRKRRRGPQVTVEIVPYRSARA